MRLRTLLVASLGGLWQVAALATPLNLCYEDAPQAPWTMPDGTGLNLELLKRVGKITGDEFIFHARPWKRCVEETRAGHMDGMIGGADSPERRSFAVLPHYPDGSTNADKALYHDHAGVYIRVGSGASWDGKDLVNPRGVVAAQRGYYVAEILQQRGWRVLDTVKSVEEGLRLVAAGMADVAVLQGRAAAELVHDDARFKGTIELAKTPYVNLPLYLHISRKVYDRDPKRIEAIWNAIPVVRATPEYRKLELEARRDD
jgi:polar amino acid transport system substrate-binding protein